MQHFPYINQLKCSGNQLVYRAVQFCLAVNVQSCCDCSVGFCEALRLLGLCGVAVQFVSLMTKCLASM